MKPTRHPLPVAALDARVFYVETSLPPGLTLPEYRRRRTARARGGTRLLRFLRGDANNRARRPGGTGAPVVTQL